MDELAHCEPDFAQGSVHYLTPHRCTLRLQAAASVPCSAGVRVSSSHIC